MNPLRSRAVLPVLLLVTAACGVTGPAVDGLPNRVDFAVHVKPILSDRCFKCHGPDQAASTSDLRLDEKDRAFARLASGARAIVPGRPRQSELVRRILSDDPDEMMPRPDSHLSLSDYEKALLVRWIDQGAEWTPHWAFTPPEMPAIPPVPDHAAAHNAIDYFVQARLAREGMSPSPEAPREPLVRRASLALTGLPPTVEEVDRFVADTSADAYERMIDRLLAAPAYGEHMAAAWLDIARYADSHGYQDDVMRDMSPWRDWVIQAFNRNMPADEFVTWQLAGDLLPDATREQRLATAFNRHHMQSQEGGIVPEEYRVEYVADRVQTFGRAFLGLGLDCARCHDHKYDPVLQREYFELFAFFNSINEAGQAPYSGMPSPTVILPGAEAEARLGELAAERAHLEALARPDHARYDDGFAAWLARDAARADAREPAGLLVHLPLDEMRERTVTRQGSSTRAAQPTRAFTWANRARPADVATLGGDLDRIPEPVDGPVGRGVRLAGDSEIHLPEGVGFFDRHQPFSVALWFRVDEAGTEGPLFSRSGGFANGFRGYLVRVEEDGRLTASLHHVAPDDSITIRTGQAIAPHTWRHLAMTYDGSSRAAGLRLFLDGELADTHVEVDNLHRSILRSGIEGNQMSGRPLTLRIGGVGELSKETLRDVSVDEFRVYERQLSGLEVAAVSGATAAIRSLIGLPAERRSPFQRDALREHYMLAVAPAHRETLARLTAIRKEENEILTAQPSVMAMRELPAPRPTFVLARGAYDAPTDRVEPGTPAALLPFPEHAPKNRLGLAQWLLDGRHPLTARVFVNRYWAQLFGRGLVATADDFGNQGALPSHPELLDWLALTFVESGWDTKALLKTIALSATFRQASVASETARQIDPDNVGLARGPAYRMSAEQIRDAALASSGLLVRTIGGPGVRPYQPEGIWEDLAYGREKYVPSTGDGLYRRSLYTVWKRVAPPPSAISFDASARLFCEVSRQRTSTPLQALVLLNDPQYVEAARVLAERVLREGGRSPAERARYAFRRVTSRSPTESELARLTDLYAAERARLAGAPAAARALRRTGARPPDDTLDPVEAAAWTMVASTILNLDEAVHTR
jgi:hypothetical protein